MFLLGVYAGGMAFMMAALTLYVREEEAEIPQHIQAVMIFLWPFVLWALLRNDKLP